MLEAVVLISAVLCGGTNSHVRKTLCFPVVRPVHPCLELGGGYAIGTCRVSCCREQSSTCSAMLATFLPKISAVVPVIQVIRSNELAVTLQLGTRRHRIKPRVCPLLS